MTVLLIVGITVVAIIAIWFGSNLWKDYKVEKEREAAIERQRQEEERKRQEEIENQRRFEEASKAYREQQEKERRERNQREAAERERSEREAAEKQRKQEQLAEAYDTAVRYYNSAMETTGEDEAARLIKEAENACNSAVRLEPDHYQVKDLKYRIESKIDELFNTARTNVLEAYRYATNTADASRRSAAKKDARIFCNRALLLKPSDDEMKNLKEKIESL